jgi:hypothetical protein
MRRLARLGAMKRLEDIRKEEASIRATFPELFNKATAAAAAPVPPPDAPVARKRRRVPKVSAAARKAISERMKKYWAEKRKAKR